MRNGIAIIMILMLASGTFFVRWMFPKAGDPLEESHAAAMDTSPPAVPATPAPADTKPPEITASAPPPPADPQPADLPPQTIPITDAVRETDTVTNVTQVPNLMDDASSRAEQQIYYKLRLGYDHTQFGRGGDTWHLGAQINVRPEAWYGHSPNLWERLLAPDITAEIGHTGIATTINHTATTGDGARVDLDAFWPWLNWTGGGNAGSVSQPNPPSKLKLSLGPTVDGAFQELTSIDDSRPEWVRYGGVRFMINHDAYVEYTVGKTDGLPGLRHQIAGEIPLYHKDGSDLRYVLRGTWNTDYSSHKDAFGISLLVEFPLDALEHPSKFKDLVPFVK